jgi:glycosyltransferase involved in cell wall biosynthesis
MNIIIYNPNSFGGNYEYAKALCKAYQEQDAVKDVKLIMPSNAKATDKAITHLLLPDIAPYKNKWLKKIYFVYRSFVNPLRFYRFLKKSDNAIVIFNDFDQLTSFYWARFFASIKKKFLFSVILHDPDRDKYLPFRWMSVASMKKVMKIMDIAFYHGYLPSKEYYQNDSRKVEVPHGIFDPVAPDAAFTKKIGEQRSGTCLIGMLGNIREEKNYELVLDAMPHLPECQLLVAGSKSSSVTPVERYKQKIADLNLATQVIWIEKFLEEDELHAAIAACDIIIMYYSESFQSQSGILNLIAPYKKKLLVSDTPSALQKAVALHRLALLVAPGNKNEFVKGVRTLINMDQNTFDNGWESYIATASWKTHVNIAVANFEQSTA